MSIRSLPRQSYLLYKMNPFAWIYRTLQFGGKTDHQDSNPHLSLSLLFEIHFLRHQSVEDIFGDEFQTIKFLFKYWPRMVAQFLKGQTSLKIKSGMKKFSKFSEFKSYLTFIVHLDVQKYKIFSFFLLREKSSGQK